MPISGNPKKLARDIAEGFFMVTPPILRQYKAEDLKTILMNLGFVLREIRQEQVPLDDTMAIKAKNMKISRLNQAEMVIRAHCRKHRIPC